MCTTRTAPSSIWPVMKESCRGTDLSSDLSFFLALSSLVRRSLALRGLVTRRRSPAKCGVQWMKCWRRAFLGTHSLERTSPGTSWSPMTICGSPCTNLASSTPSLGPTMRSTTNLGSRGCRMSAYRVWWGGPSNCATNWFTTYIQPSIRRQWKESRLWELCGMNSLKMSTRLMMTLLSSCLEIHSSFVRSLPIRQLMQKAVNTFSLLIAFSPPTASGTSGMSPSQLKVLLRGNSLN